MNRGNRTIRITESEIRDMVRESVERILESQREKIGDYEIMNGDCFTKNYAPSLKEFGAFLEIRMYYSKHHTYCLHCRYDDGMLFWTEIVPAPELGKNQTKYRPISVSKVPSIILHDARALFRKLKKERKTVS